MRSGSRVRTPASRPFRQLSSEAPRRRGSCSELHQAELLQMVADAGHIRSCGSAVGSSGAIRSAADLHAGEWLEPALPIDAGEALITADAARLGRPRLKVLLYRLAPRPSQTRCTLAGACRGALACARSVEASRSIGKGPASSGRVLLGRDSFSWDVPSQLPGVRHRSILLEDAAFHVRHRSSQRANSLTSLSRCCEPRRAPVTGARFAGRGVRSRRRRPRSRRRKPEPETGAPSLCMQPCAACEERGRLRTNAPAVPVSCRERRGAVSARVPPAFSPVRGGDPRPRRGAR